jgi:ABC-2 type transport system ATP-binding protein
MLLLSSPTLAGSPPAQGFPQENGKSWSGRRPRWGNNHQRMIRTRDLGKTFSPPPWPLSLVGRPPTSEIRALERVSLDIDSGEVFGVIGPNGAGKTTLLKILSTLILPSSGTARVNGSDLIRGADAVRRSVGIAAGEERGFYWRLTGMENLEFFAGLRGFAPREARRRAAHALELVDLLPRAGEPVMRYTTGMRQRLSLARALLARPPILLLDEPTRSLDPGAAQTVQALVRRLSADDGVTIMIATHNLEEAEAVCSRVAVLADGAVRSVVSVASGDGRLRDRYATLLGVSS